MLPTTAVLPADQLHVPLSGSFLATMRVIDVHFLNRAVTHGIVHFIHSVLVRTGETPNKFKNHSDPRVKNMSFYNMSGI